MFSIVTPCGRRVLFSDSDWEKMQGISVYYEKATRCLSYKTNENRKMKGSLLAYLFDTEFSQDYGYLYADGNRYNLQRENVKQIPRGDSFRFRPPLCGKKYKGVCKRLRCKKFVRWFTLICVNNYCSFFIPCDSEIHAAATYNAVCDYLKFDGYRNEVEKIVLTNELQKYIDTMLCKWGMKDVCD